MLTEEFLDQHIEYWEKWLANSSYPHRSKWPGHLFHHAPIENAVEIIKLGYLLSRDDSVAKRKRDVAGQEVIATRSNAHAFARLYFRPRTPTQFHIEGVRKAHEYFNNEPAAHAPVLVMFVFDAKRVLLREGTAFSKFNMQAFGSEWGTSRDYFTSIEFDKVFHEGPFGDDRSIKKCRCAEVLAKSPLPLNEHLKWIVCRSHPERQMLLEMLGEAAASLAPRIHVSDDILVFEKRHTYVEEVGIQRDGVVWRLNPRRDGQPILTQVIVKNTNGQTVVSFGPLLFAPFPPAARRWIAPQNMESGTYDVEVQLEGCLAYKGTHTLTSDPF